LVGLIIWHNYINSVNLYAQQLTVMHIAACFQNNYSDICPSEN